MIRRAAALLLLLPAACLDEGEIAIEPSFVPLAEVQATMPETLDDIVGCEGVVPGQFIVTLREGARPDPQLLIGRHALSERLGLRTATSLVVHGVTADRRAALERDQDVAAVEPDAIACASNGGDFGDEDGDGQAGKGRPGGGGTPAPQAVPAGVDRVGADEIANTGARVTVCIVDSGVDYNHADLSARFGATKGHDFINNDTDPLDDNGHGTHVAGTVAATDNTGDVVGMAEGATLLAAKVLNRRGSGSYSAIIAGVEKIQRQVHPSEGK